MLLDDERVTFVEGSVRRSIGRALIGEAASAGEAVAAEDDRDHLATSALTTTQS